MFWRSFGVIDEITRTFTKISVLLESEEESSCKLSLLFVHWRFFFFLFFFLRKQTEVFMVGARAG